GLETSTGIQVMFRRARKRSSARTSAGPKARQKTTLPTACATLNGNEVALIARYWASVCPPENVVNVERSEIAPHGSPNAQQVSALLRRQRAAQAAEDARGLGGEVPAAGEHLARGTVGDHAAVGEQHDPLGDGDRELRVMRGDDHGRVERVQAIGELALGGP